MAASNPFLQPLPRFIRQQRGWTGLRGAVRAGAIRARHGPTRELSRSRKDTGMINETGDWGCRPLRRSRHLAQQIVLTVKTSRRDSIETDAWRCGYRRTLAPPACNEPELDIEYPPD